ncbi:MAG: SH3 domain-containing protein [Acidaminococcaceae bacterium]|nr:SH3 domain-containing protein [Acidaminococcaceae bacterium]
MRSLITMILSAVLLLSIVGCGGGDKKSEQTPAKTVTTQEVKKEAPKEENTGFIIGTDVNAREKASTDSGIVGTYDLGEKVTILADEGEWARVKRANGQECYVFKKFLGTQEDLDKRQAKYNIKDGPYAVYLNGNPDYVLLYGHMGTAWYVVKNSLRKSQTSRNAIDVVSVNDADKGNTNIASTTTFNYWYNDVGIEYWLEDRPGVERFLATPDGKGVQNIIAFSAFQAISYLKSGKIPHEGKSLPQEFYDRLNQQ